MKDQFVIAHLDDSGQYDAVLSYAQFLAKRLDKGIILFYVCDKRYRNLPTDEMMPQLKSLQQQLADHGVSASYVALNGDTRKAIDLLPTKLNGVVSVIGCRTESSRRSFAHPHEVLRAYAQSKIAYLCVNEPLANEKSLDHVALSIDFHKESKDKLIWSSYFARFNHSSLELLHEDYHDEGLRNKWRNNMKFLDKFYANLNLTYTPHIVQRKGPFLDPCAANYAVEQGYSLLISVTTDLRAKDPLEFFIGTQEQHLLKHQQLPILFLNPRDDIYVLCD